MGNVVPVRFNKSLVLGARTDVLNRGVDVHLEFRVAAFSGVGQLADLIEDTPPEH